MQHLNNYHLNAAGWLAPQAGVVAHVYSPFYNLRPKSTPIEVSSSAAHALALAHVIDTIIIHNISLPPSCFGGTYIHQLFSGALGKMPAPAITHPYLAAIKDQQVSAHFMIDRLGMVFQYVSTHCRAWHAGKSTLLQRQNCNDFSIGIELEGDDFTAFTAAQYRSLWNLCHTLMAYPAHQIGYIAAHSYVAPERKTDPGAYFEPRILEDELRNICASTGMCKPVFLF